MLKISFIKKNKNKNFPDNLNIYTTNEFSDLSNDYTIQEFEFKKGNNYPSVKGRLKKNLIFW